MSYENEINDKYRQGGKLPEKLDISILRYFWEANPLTSSKVDNIPRYLREVDVLKNFTDNELRILSRSMHHRTFANKEVIFQQGDIGVGFYFIYSGYADVIVDNDFSANPAEKENPMANYILSLEKFDYFGELALLQENSIRNASVIAREHCELLGIFKPDVEELINTEPVIATKLLQSVSVIISNRLFSLTKEVKELKYRLAQLESSNE